MTDSLGATLGERASKNPGHAVEPALVLALECSRPTASSVRYLLRNTSVVVIGRGRERSSETTPGNSQELAIRVADRWMSTKHARIEHAVGRWVLVDTDSKNGTTVDGLSTRRVPLVDGSLIELGHTLFLFSDRYPSPESRSSPPVLDLGIADSAPGSVSLETALAGRLVQLRSVAPTNLPVLIVGEPGTGKSTLARLVVEWSSNAGPVVEVRGSELTDPAKAFAKAQGGTLIIDELTQVQLPVQAALERELERATTVRIIAISSSSLDDVVTAGDVVPSLLQRLAGFRVDLPPLSKRRFDLGLLITNMLRTILPDGHPGLEVEAARHLLRYPWPLNLRELQQVLTAAAVLAGDNAIAGEHLPETVRTGRPPGAPRTAILSDEDSRVRDELVLALREHLGNVSAVARALNKDRKQIQRWLKRFALDTASFR